TKAMCNPLAQGVQFPWRPSFNRRGYMRHSHHFRFLTASAVLITLVLLPEPAMAFDVFWTAGTGNWNHPGNWDQVAVPEADPFEDIGIINNGGTATLSVAAPDA